MATKTGTVGTAGSHVYYDTPKSMNVTLAAGEYPSGTITFTKMNTTDKGMSWNNVWSTKAATVSVYICDSAGNNAVKLFDVSLRAINDGYDYLKYAPNSANISGATALAGKALYMKMTGNTGGATTYGTSPVTITTAMLYTAVTAGNKIKKEDINQTGTSITAGTKINASIKSGLTAGTKITASDFNSKVLGL